MSVTYLPKSAAALTYCVERSGSIPEPMDCTMASVLDLCTRPRNSSQSPKPEGARQPIKGSPEVATSTACSPSLLKSDVDSSEEGSIQSETFQDLSQFGNASFIPKHKVTRPFKAYPKDPFFLAIGASSADALLGQESTEAYVEFRNKMLSQVRASNPQPGVTNPKMRRTSLPTSPLDSGKDASYWEKRRRNNEAAKRSRDARRAKEDEIAIRAAFLEQENLRLKYEIAALRNENAKLRCMMYN